MRVFCSGRPQSKTHPFQNFLSSCMIDSLLLQSYNEEKRNCTQKWGSLLKITTQRIAELAGVSRGAVDKTIHGRPGVRADVRRRILQVIQETGYVSPQERKRAQAAHPRETTVAVVLPRLSNPHFAAMKRSMDEQCRVLPGMHLEYYPFDTADTAGMLAALDRLAARSVDAYLFRGVSSTRIRDKLAAMGKPVIFIDSDVPGAPRLCLVGEDCHKSGRIAASLLAKSVGFQGQVAVMAGMPTISSHQQRLAGFLDVMRLDYPDIEVLGPVYTQDQSAVAYSRTLRLLEDAPALQGICNLAGCSGAIGQAILDRQRRRAVRLVCYNTGDDVAALIRRGVATFSISIAPREQGRILVQTIYHYLYHGKPPAADWIKVPITIAIDENVDSLEADFGPRDMG